MNLRAFFAANSPFSIEINYLFHELVLFGRFHSVGNYFYQKLSAFENLEELS